ncbi:DNA replication protein DnaD [Clostridium tetani]|uniref:Lin1244/Lin1753 domain-containing protein n=1 Tax=Clostridium tetani TaxID=1513 RepID=UPI00100C0EFD|nr:Lin1244/Lin1753 domain-containing protein [Clostridium tetani]RXM53927.1 DNA replication protein DnaD [Clostridium tetani]
MARPQKEGLDYFPLDVDIDQDDKIVLIEAQHGIEGFGVVIKLLMKIYKNSYFYEWTEKEQLLFSKRVNVNINEVNAIINDCVKWELFDKKLLETSGILTSKGIQKRYLMATSRRQRVEIEGKYLLLDEKEVTEYKNLVIVNINEINEDINPQSKVKESKGKESKVNNNSSTVSYIEFFNSNFHMISSYELEILRSYEKDGLDPGVIKLALEEAIGNNVRTIKYVKSILQNWLEKNIKTVEAVKAEKEKFKRETEEKKTKYSNVERKDNGAKIDSFNGYQQRTYDGSDGGMTFDDLEKKLLGWK